MNAPDVLKYGHAWFSDALEGMPKDQWDSKGVAGTWSAKDVLSHITSYEVILVVTLKEFVSKGKSDINPMSDHQKFNDEETEKRRGKNFQEVLDEYNKVYEEVAAIIGQVPVGKCRELGTLTWYGSEYSLDDYLVYAYYGHKREHGGQIALWVK